MIYELQSLTQEGERWRVCIAEPTGKVSTMLWQGENIEARAEALVERLNAYYVGEGKRSWRAENTMQYNKQRYKQAMQARLAQRK